MTRAASRDASARPSTSTSRRDLACGCACAIGADPKPLTMGVGDPVAVAKGIADSGEATAAVRGGWLSVGGTGVVDVVCWTGILFLEYAHSTPPPDRSLMHAPLHALRWALYTGGTGPGTRTCGMIFKVILPKFSLRGAALDPWPGSRTPHRTRPPVGRQGAAPTHWGSSGFGYLRW